jgi:hypothetical protein
MVKEAGTGRGEGGRKAIYFILSAQRRAGRVSNPVGAFCCLFRGLGRSSLIEFDKNTDSN